MERRRGLVDGGGETAGGVLFHLLGCTTRKERTMKIVLAGFLAMALLAALACATPTPSTTTATPAHAINAIPHGD